MHRGHTSEDAFLLQPFARHSGRDAAHAGQTCVVGIGDTQMLPAGRCVGYYEDSLRIPRGQ